MDTIVRTRRGCPIIVVALSDDADTRLTKGQIFDGASPFSKVMGYSAACIRQKLVATPVGPATLRGISFQYLNDYITQKGKV